MIKFFAIKILAPLGFSIAFLIISQLRTESTLRMRKQRHNENPKAERLWRRKTDLIAWAIFTVAIFIFFIFFAKV